MYNIIIEKNMSYSKVDPLQPLLGTPYEKAILIREPAVNIDDPDSLIGSAQKNRGVNYYNQEESLFQYIEKKDMISSAIILNE